MNAFEQLALGWQSVRIAMGGTRRRALWLAFAATLAAQGVSVFVLAFGAHPWLSPLVERLVHRLVGHDAIHYPELLLRLPVLAARVDQAVGITLTPLATGVATLLFADLFRGRPLALGPAFATALRAWPALVVLHLPAEIGGFAGAFLADRVALLPVSALTRAATPLLSFGSAVLAQALCVFAPALLLVEGHGLRGTLARLPGAARRGATAALTIVVLLLVPLVAVIALGQAAPVVAARLAPEALIAVVLGQFAIAAWTGIAGAGAALLALQSLARPEEAW